MSKLSQTLLETHNEEYTKIQTLTKENYANSRATGEESVGAELLNCGGRQLQTQLQHTIQKVRIEEDRIKIYSSFKFDDQEITLEEVLQVICL